MLLRRFRFRRLRAPRVFSTLALLAVTGATCSAVPAEGREGPGRTAILAALSADKLFAEGKFGAARSAYASAVKSGVTNMTARLGLIRTLLRLDEWQAAIRESEKALAAAPRNADAHGVYGYALMRAGRPEAAAQEAKRALALDPKSYWGLVAQGRTRLFDGDKAGAQKGLLLATTLAPSTPDAWYWLMDTFEEGQGKAFYGALRTFVAQRPQGYPYDQVFESLSGALEASRKMGEEETFRAEKGPLSGTARKPKGGREKAGGNGDAGTESGELEGEKLKGGKPENDKADDRNVSMTFTVERDKDDIIVPLLINGKAFRLLFDTGAGDSIALGRDAANRLSLAILGDTVVHGVSGKETSHLSKADQLEIGSQTFRNVPLEFIDNNIGTNDGLIGGGVFADYAVTVDFEDNSMTLTQGKEAKAPAALSGDRLISLPFKNLSNYIFIPIKIEGKSSWALLDTGAQVTTLLSLNVARALAEKRPELTTAEVEVSQRLGVGVSNTTFTAVLFRFGVEVGLQNGAKTVYFNEVDPIYGASMMDNQVCRSYNFQLGAIVGIHYLARAKRVTFDYPHRVLTIEMRDTAEGN